jgi:ABC-type bacteriocin/lantibiotic exporter with double-glycine peptidase domain
MPKTSLPIIPPLPIPHRKQKQDADCLAACAAMVLTYLNHPVTYAELLALLRIGPLGTPRRNVSRLARLGLDISYREATLPIVAAYLQAGQPVITFVDTAELAYWSFATNHAIVVIGLDATDVIVNDPAFDTAPHHIPHDEFELAWLNSDNTCTVIKVQ